MLVLYIVWKWCIQNETTYKLETKIILLWYGMKYDTAGKYKSTYKFEKKSSTFDWYFVNCPEMYTIVEKTFATKLIQGRSCMKQRDTGITVKDNKEAEVPVHLNSTSIRYISYLIFTCLLILSNAWKLKSIKSIELLTFMKEGKEISCFCSKWIVSKLWELSAILFLEEDNRYQ